MFCLFFNGLERRAFGFTLNPIKLETGVRTSSAGVPYALLFKDWGYRVSNFGLLQTLNPKP